MLVNIQKHRMKTRRSLTIIVLLTWTTKATDSVGPVYKKVGDNVVLTLNSAAVHPGDPITSIMWKHEADIAVEWYGGEPSSYRQFEDRGVLNTSTGALTITGLTGGESGRYTAEINNKAVNASQLLAVVSPVPKPTVSIWCEPEKAYCLFTCECNTTGAEPITYVWRAGDVVRESTKVYNTTKMMTEQSFSCKLENPVSDNFSDSVPNPFINFRNRKWTLLCIIPFGGILLVCVLFCMKERSETRDRDAPVDEEAAEVCETQRQSVSSP